MSDFQNYPIINFPYLYKYGMQLSFNGDDSLFISAGMCRDSNNIIDIEIGGTTIEGNINPRALTVDFTKNGANGLDVGSIVQNQMYAIYMIADSKYYKPTACIACIATNAPVVPVSYDSIRIIGYWGTDRDQARLNPGYYYGIGNDLTFFNAATQSVNNFTGPSQRVDLSNFVPPVQNCLVKFYNQILGNAAGINSWISPNPVVGIVYATTTVGINVSSWSSVDMICPIDPSTGYPSFFVLANTGSNVGIIIAGFSFSV